MAELDDIINQAIDAAESGEVDAPEPEYQETEPTEPDETTEPDADESEPQTTEEEPESSGELVPEPDEKKPDDKKPVEKKESKESDADKALTKLLEEHGVKAPKPGERENKIPHSRVRKIVANGIKRADERWQGEVSKRETELTTLRETNKNYANAERIAAEDPDRYVALLAAHNPAYKKFLTPPVETKTGEAKPITVPDEKDDPKPQPDLKYQDGSVGYTDEQHDKLLEWAGRKGARQALVGMESRFKPLESAKSAADKAEQDARDRSARVEAIRRDASVLRSQFGDLFTADERLAESGKSEIIAYQREHRCGLLEAGMAVLVPKMRADKAKVRKELMEENKKRTTVVRSAPAGTKKPAHDPNEPRSLEDVINDAVDAAGIK